MRLMSIGFTLSLKLMRLLLQSRRETRFVETQKISHMNITNVKISLVAAFCLLFSNFATAQSSNAMTNEQLMKEAIRLSEENVVNGGGPFGAVIARNGEIIATGVNRVTSNNDPTAHAEVSAIRAVCEKLGTFDLSGCEIFTSCEPCPMCLGAIYWAHIDKVYFGNDKTDAKNIGFDDSFIYDELELPRDKRKLSSEILLEAEAFRAFEMWINKTDKIEY